MIINLGYYSFFFNSIMYQIYFRIVWIHFVNLQDFSSLIFILILEHFIDVDIYWICVIFNISLWIT